MAPVFDLGVGIALGNMEAALIHLRKALAVRDEIGDLSKSIETESALALALFASGESADALAYLARALDAVERGEYRTTLRQEVYWVAFRIRSAQGDVSEALRYLGAKEGIGAFLGKREPRWQGK